MLQRTKYVFIAAWGAGIDMSHYPASQLSSVAGQVMTTWLGEENMIEPVNTL